MGGSCINREVEHLDVYRRSWQVFESCRDRCRDILYLCMSSLSFVFLLLPILPMLRNVFEFILVCQRVRCKRRLL